MHNYEIFNTQNKNLTIVITIIKSKPKQYVECNRYDQCILMHLYVDTVRRENQNSIFFFCFKLTRGNYLVKSFSLTTYVFGCFNRTLIKIQIIYRVNLS